MLLNITYQRIVQLFQLHSYFNYIFLEYFKFLKVKSHIAQRKRREKSRNANSLLTDWILGSARSFIYIKSWLY